MNRVLWFFFGSLGVIALAGIIVALRQLPLGSSGPLKLPDGSLVHLVAVTYGTNHLVGRPLARLVARMPPRAQVVVKRLLGSRARLQYSTKTPEPRLIVWLGRATNNASLPSRSGYLSALLSDATGFLSGDRISLDNWRSNLQPLWFHVFPRRDRVIAVNLFFQSPTGGVTRCGSLPFANPAFGTFPQWKPEPLPATRQAGDVAVTLQKLSTGHDQNTEYESRTAVGGVLKFGTNRLDGRNQTVCAIQFRPLANTNEAWQAANEVLSDATGNRAANIIMGWGTREQGYFTFEPGLWPNELAWKLRCEIKRTGGFAPGETFVFRDVPLGILDRTNLIGWTTNFNGVTVTLDHVLRRAPNPSNQWSSDTVSQAQFRTAGLTNALHLDLLSVRTDLGTNLQSRPWSSTNAWRQYSFRDVPLEAKALDFTFAVHLSRWVEFAVKPEVGPLELEHEPQKRK
jgi:hypothetical protein